MHDKLCAKYNIQDFPILVCTNHTFNTCFIGRCLTPCSRKNFNSKMALSLTEEMCQVCTIEAVYYIMIFIWRVVNTAKHNQWCHGHQLIHSVHVSPLKPIQILKSTLILLNTAFFHKFRYSSKFIALCRFYFVASFFHIFLSLRMTPFI